MTATNSHIRWYLVLLALHLVHVVEEIYGRFFVLGALGGPGPFVLVNVILFAIPTVVLVLIWRGYRWALYAGVAYAVIMTLNGLAHIVGFLVTGRYMGMFAGAISGIAFLVVAPMLAAHLRRELRQTKP
jgi:hypothetical protein